MNGYYKIRNEQFYIEDPCDHCGKFGGISVIETVVTWGKQPRAYHKIKCNNCGLEQVTLSWNLDPVESEQES